VPLPTPNPRLRLYTYDFKEPGGETERRKLRELIEAHGGTRLQYSTYALLAEPRVHARLLQKITHRIEFREGDSLLTAPVCQRCLKRTLLIDHRGVRRLEL